MKKPFVSGEWKILYKPEKTGTYVNDHFVLKDGDDYYITTCGWLGQDLPFQGAV